MHACVRLSVKHVVNYEGGRGREESWREGGGRREGGDEADMYKYGKNNIHYILLCKQWEVLVIKRKLHPYHHWKSTTY